MDFDFPQVRQPSTPKSMVCSLGALKLSVNGIL
jgi:hypothetical protein